MLCPSDAKHGRALLWNGTFWQNTEVSLMKFTIFFSVFLLASVANAQTTLENFKAGEYQLVRGRIEICGDGEAVYDPKVSHLMIGYLHGFFTKNQNEVFDGDAPTDADCKYLSENSLSAGAKNTTLVFTEVRKCGGNEKHRLQKTAILEPGKISLSAVQTGEPRFTYNCEWKLKGPLK